MLANLGWLVAPAADFDASLKALRKEVAAGPVENLDAKVVRLATARLDTDQLNKLARLAGDIIKHKAPLGTLLKLKLGIVGDGTLSLLRPTIIGTALRHGLVVEAVEGHFGSMVQEALDPDSDIRTAGLDVALIVSDVRALGLDSIAASAEDAANRVEAAFQQIKLVADNLRPSVSSSIFVQTLVPPFENLFGSFDRLESTSPFGQVAEFNRRVAAWAATGAVTLLDVERLAASVGYEHWNDPRHWHASKLSFSPDLLPAYADLVARTLGALRGRAKKCLVLDLDNTLWGGIIGDDGLNGIKLGQGSAAGEAHVAIQRLALDLRTRGIVLAVCSKNEDDAARLPFRDHPDMLLREDHIAVFKANWTDKASNLKVIAETLNIGIDSLVFLDDNPAERMQVRDALPFVGVPEVGSDPAYYPRILSAAGYFEALAYSKEDRERAAMYQANAERQAAMAASGGDLGDYLRSLDMVCTISPVDAVSRPRVSQLIGKSNQFNLTTRRYSEAEVAAAEADNKRHISEIRLVDRFGDNGIIAVLVADKLGEAWEIDTWLMSCRVLGRRVEEASLAHLAAAAKRDGAKLLVGKYIPSPKNKMVANHYGKLGFTKVEEGEDGSTVWHLDLNAYELPALEMKVEDRTVTVDA